MQNHPTAAAKSASLQYSRAKLCSRLCPGASAGWLVQTKPVLTPAQQRRLCPLKVHQISFPSHSWIFIFSLSAAKGKKKKHTIKASYCSSQLAVLLPLVCLAVMYLCLCICIPLFLGARYTKKQGRAKPAAYCSQGAPAAVPSCGRSQLLQPHDLLCPEE